MALQHILNLNNSIGARTIRCLYMVALILITIMVVLGVVRGVRTMMRTPPPPRPAIAQNQAAPAPGAATAPQPPRPGMMNPAQRRMMMMRRFGPPPPRGPLGILGGLPRNPPFAGLVIILATLLRGMIILMVVRILAEMGLAVLAMPRRSES